MSPIQQMLLGVGAVATKTYVDDVFSTYLYEGNDTARSINNGIDLAGEGGMTWIKRRDSAFTHVINDTVRGAGKWLRSNTNNGQTVDSNRLTAFNNNGFALAGGDGDVNSSAGSKYSSWSFRKAPGFFDVVTYTGTGSARTISHSLGSIPGMIMVKKTSDSEDWTVYHRGVEETKWLYLNTSNATQSGNANPWNGTSPTASVFSLGTHNLVNENGATYVAYIFAGGESTAATARSVDFDDNADRINIGDASNKSSDLNFGSGDFTWECWIKADASQDSYPRIIHNNPTNTDWGSNASMIIWDHDSQPDRISFFVYNENSSGSTPTVRSAVKGWNGDGQWHHVAVTRSSNVFRLFSDGVLEDTLTWSGSLDNADAYMGIGQRPDSTSASESFKGSISNVRIVKGTAVYTSSFKPSTQPLTNITNTKLLCCNNSSVTGSTVTPLTISANNSPTASSDSPFDDPAGFVFGDAEDQGVIKCGSYVGSGSSALEVNLGFEPQWVMVKNTDTTGWWTLSDTMRGLDVDASTTRVLYPNANNAEGDTDLTCHSTGFGLKAGSSSSLNGDGNTMIYMALRRPDGYVGKPPELGTGVFAMDTGAGSSIIPNFDSGFPVDFAFARQVASSANWDTSARLIGTNFLRTDTSGSQGTSANFTWDSNVGWNKHSNYNSGAQSWMFKRHAGFDVVAYKGNGTSGNKIPHNLSKTPEMIWIKNRDETRNWPVYHKGLNGGTDPADHYIYLNMSSSESNDAGMWNDTMPTSTHFTLGNYGEVNNFQNYIALLFASVDGISKVGYYDGQNSTITVSLGFQPRFLIVKNTTSGYAWYVFSTGGSLSMANDQFLQLNNNNAVNTGGYGDFNSTSFELAGNVDETNESGEKYIYYAHA